MKKQILTALLSLGVVFVTDAQTVVTDTVEIGAGYANQVWYSMANDEQGTAAKDNWDIAFDLVGITSGIRVNTTAGAMLWNYPKGDQSAWSSVDTAGLSTWTPRYNSDTSWALGAIGAYADPNDPYDLDWGSYDITTHTVVGDSIFIIQLVNGDFKKLYIEKLLSGAFTFKFANLDGSNETTVTLKKTEYASDLGFFSIANNQKLTSRAPDYSMWDLCFTQYTGFVPTAYSVTGILHNRLARVARADNLPNVTSYNNWQAHTESSTINTIGYNWKSFNGTGYSIQDSLAYFIHTAHDEVWKLVMTGFDNTTGRYVFNKSLLKAASVTALNNNDITVVIVS